MSWILHFYASLSSSSFHVRSFHVLLFFPFPSISLPPTFSPIFLLFITLHSFFYFSSSVNFCFSFLPAIPPFTPFIHSLALFSFLLRFSIFPPFFILPPPLVYSFPLPLSFLHSSFHSPLFYFQVFPLPLSLLYHPFFICFPFPPYHASLCSLVCLSAT